jgi:hypothetical protein
MESLEASEETDLSSLVVTFALVAAAQLALAEGDARRAAMALGATDGLRRRAGLRAWPSMRPREAQLATRVSEAMDGDDYTEAFAAGSDLSQRQAVALVRGDSSQEGGRDRGG